MRAALFLAILLTGCGTGTELTPYTPSASDDGNPVLSEALDLPGDDGAATVVVLPFAQ